MVRDKAPEEQNLSVTQRLSGKLKATGYGEVAIPSDWTFIDPEREDRALISRIVARGPCWRCWEQTSAWHSKFKGYFAPRFLVKEERQKLIEERDHWLQEKRQETSNLIVYEVGDWQKEGVSELRLGRISVPEGWELLESGDALLTRRVKVRGKYWEYYHELKTKAYDKKLGIFAPANIIEEERRKISSERRTKEYEQRLQRSRKSREKKEAKYGEEFAEACFRFLNFDLVHEDLAWQIAWGATSVATDVGSGRVGRTGKLPLEEKAELAVRAFIRHNFTDYDERLDEMGEPWYHEIRGDAAAKVNRFLEEHRCGPSG
ncbi:MAG: DUF2293 domain-containing protein [Dehalococcoidia bacterium]|nr:MAG: DUF2293 domain-containing protein [Dehalococcoidia bacterium]